MALRLLWLLLLTTFLWPAEAGAIEPTRKERPVGRGVARHGRAELHARSVPAYWATPRGAESRSWGGRVGCVREAAAPTRYGGDIPPQT